MPIEQITTPIFLSVSKETRDKIRKEFLIGMSGHAEVVTDQFGKATVLCDGTTNSDLQNLTVEKMRDFLGTAAVNETVYDLFKRVVEKIEEPEKIAKILEVDREEGIKSGILSPEPIIQQTEKPQTINNVNKCPDCEYTHASKNGLRMHIMKKHLHK